MKNEEVEKMELELTGISKSYDHGKTYAVSGLSVCFTPGIYGLLGENGAGRAEHGSNGEYSILCSFVMLFLNRILHFIKEGGKREIQIVG